MGRVLNSYLRRFRGGLVSPRTGAGETGFCASSGTVSQNTPVSFVNVSYVGDLTQTFRDVVIDTRYAHSKTPAAGRGSLAKNFKIIGRMSSAPANHVGSLFLPPNHRCGHPKYRLRHRRLASTVAECYGSFLLFAPSIP